MDPVRDLRVPHPNASNSPPPGDQKRTKKKVSLACTFSLLIEMFIIARGHSEVLDSKGGQRSDR